MLVDFVFYTGLVAVFFAFAALFYRITSFLFAVFIGNYVVIQHVAPDGELISKRVKVTSEDQLITAISELRKNDRNSDAQ